MRKKLYKWRAVKRRCRTSVGMRVVIVGIVIGRAWSTRWLAKLDRSHAMTLSRWWDVDPRSCWNHANQAPPARRRCLCRRAARPASRRVDIINRRRTQVVRGNLMHLSTDCDRTSTAHCHAASSRRWRDVTLPQKSVLSKWPLRIAVHQALYKAQQYLTTHTLLCFSLWK